MTTGSRSGVSPSGAQEGLIESGPDRFFPCPPYVGHRGWLGVSVDVPVDWHEIESIVREAYRVVAPAHLGRQLDGDDPR